MFAFQGPRIETASRGVDDDPITMAIEAILAGTIAHLSKFQFGGELVADGQTSVLRGECMLRVHGARERSSLFRVPDMSWCGFIKSASWMPKVKVQPPYRPCKPNPVSRSKTVPVSEKRLEMIRRLIIE